MIVVHFEMDVVFAHYIAIGDNHPSLRGTVLLLDFLSRCPALQ